MNQLFSFAFENIIPDVPSTAYFGNTIESTASEIDRLMYVGWRKRDELNPAVISSAIENVLNSNETFWSCGDETTLGGHAQRNGKTDETTPTNHWKYAIPLQVHRVISRIAFAFHMRWFLRRFAQIRKIVRQRI